MSKVSDDSVNKILVGVLVFLCVVIVGLGAGLVAIRLYDDPAALLANCKEDLSQDVSLYVNSLTTNYEQLGEIANSYDSCIELAQPEEQIDIRNEKIKFISTYDLDRRFGDMLIGDAVVNDSIEQSVDTAIILCNLAASYNDDVIFQEYHNKMVERLASDGIDYDSEGSG